MSRRDRITVCAMCVISGLALAGSILGIIRIAQLRHEERALEAAANFYRLVRETHESAWEAKRNPDHPARGLIALTNVMVDAIEAQLELNALEAVHE